MPDIPTQSPCTGIVGFLCFSSNNSDTFKFMSCHFSHHGRKTEPSQEWWHCLAATESCTAGNMEMENEVGDAKASARHQHSSCHPQDRERRGGWEILAGKGSHDPHVGISSSILCPFPLRDRSPEDLWARRVSFELNYAESSGSLPASSHLCCLYQRLRCSLRPPQRSAVIASPVTLGAASHHGCWRALAGSPCSSVLGCDPPWFAAGKEG